MVVAAAELPHAYTFLQKNWGSVFAEVIPTIWEDGFPRDNADALHWVGVLPVAHAAVERAGGLIPFVGSRGLWEHGKEPEALQLVDELARMSLDVLLAYAESGRYQGHLDAESILARSVLADISLLSGSNAGSGINRQILEKGKDEKLNPAYLSLAQSGKWQRPYWALRIAQVSLPEEANFVTASRQNDMMQATVQGLCERWGVDAVGPNELSSMVFDLLIAVTRQSESFQNPHYLRQILSKLDNDHPPLPEPTWGSGLARGIANFVDVVLGDTWSELAPTFSSHEMRGDLVHWALERMTSLDSSVARDDENAEIWKSIDSVAALAIRASHRIPTDLWRWIALELFDTAPQVSYPNLLTEIKSLWNHEEGAHRQEFYRVVPPLVAGTHKSELFHGVMDLLQEGGDEGMKAQLEICQTVMHAAIPGSGKSERIPPSIVERARSTVESFFH